jgi:hypothetical protein
MERKIGGRDHTRRHTNLPAHHTYRLGKNCFVCQFVCGSTVSFCLVLRNRDGAKPRVVCIKIFPVPWQPCSYAETETVTNYLTLPITLHSGCQRPKLAPLNIDDLILSLYVSACLRPNSYQIPNLTPKESTYHSYITNTVVILGSQT